VKRLFAIALLALPLAVAAFPLQASARLVETRIPGHWHYNSNGTRYWVNGYWSSQNRAWIPGHWQYNGNGTRYWVNGYWSRG